MLHRPWGLVLIIRRLPFSFKNKKRKKKRSKAVRRPAGGWKWSHQPLWLKFVNSLGPGHVAWIRSRKIAIRFLPVRAIRQADVKDIKRCYHSASAGDQTNPLIPAGRVFWVSIFCVRPLISWRHLAAWHSTCCFGFSGTAAAVIVDGPQSARTQAGSLVDLQCTATGDPLPRITWHIHRQVNGFFFYQLTIPAEGGRYAKSKIDADAAHRRRQFYWSFVFGRSRNARRSFVCHFNDPTDCGALVTRLTAWSCVNSLSFRPEETGGLVSLVWVSTNGSLIPACYGRCLAHHPVSGRPHKSSARPANDKRRSVDELWAWPCVFLLIYRLISCLISPCRTRTTTEISRKKSDRTSSCIRA